MPLYSVYSVYTRSRAARRLHGRREGLTPDLLRTPGFFAAALLFAPASLTSVAPDSRLFYACFTPVLRLTFA